MSAEMRQCMGIHPLCTEISGQRCRVFAQRRQPERKILFRHRREMTGADIDLLQHKVLGQNFHRAVVQAVQERFNAGDDTHIGKVLVHFDLQVGLIPHFLLEQMGQHGIRAAAVVGQIHRIQVWVMGDELCAGQDVLSERIIQIFVFVRNVQRMTGQMAQGNDLVSAFQQQFRDTHVQDGVGNAIVPGDEHQNFVLRFQGRQQCFALLFHCGSMAAHRHGTAEQSLCAERLRDAQHLAQPQHGGGHSLLPEVQIKYRAEQGDALAFDVQCLCDGHRRRLHIDAAVVVLHPALFVFHGVDAG